MEHVESSKHAGDGQPPIEAGSAAQARWPGIQTTEHEPSNPGPQRSHQCPDLEEIARATRAAYRDLLDSDDQGRTGMNPDATHTILAMIATWGIPILRIGGLHPERTWLWADLHLRDRASVRYHHRPFWCWRTHDRALKRRWDRAVAPADTIIHVGDLAPESVGEQYRRRMLETLPGWKINVLGNHDVAALHAPLTDGWNATHGALVIASAPPLVITHCPLRTVPAGTVNVHGHMHRRRDRRFDPRINVAVDQTGYHPVSASTLIEEAARRLAGNVPRPLDSYRTTKDANENRKKR